jgi:hypothetical protein
MSGDYYQRSGGRASDGTSTFSNDADRAGEEKVARFLETLWHCELGRFGHLAAIDYYATRHGRLSAVVEIKSRSHETGRYSTVFLNLRKWLALTLAACGFGVPALYVVRFTDDVRWIDATEASGRQVRIGGCSERVKARSDVEPVIEIPVAAMASLGVLT